MDIMIDKEDLEFLQQLSKELNTQPNDGNADPVFWVVAQYQMEPCWEDVADDTFFYCSEINSSFFETFEEFKKEYEEYSGETFDWEDISDVPDDLVVEIPVKRVHTIVPDTMFLTKEDAKKHIELNSHHYNNTAHTYAMTAWRSPTVDRLIKILKKGFK